MKPYAFQIGLTKHLLPARSDDDARTIAELINAKLLGEVKGGTCDGQPFCEKCMLPLVCPDCGDFDDYYFDH